MLIKLETKQLGVLVINVNLIKKVSFWKNIAYIYLVNEDDSIEISQEVWQDVERILENKECIQYVM